MLQEFLGLKKFRRFFLLRLFESRKKEHAESICNPSPCAFASLWLCVKKEVYSAGSAFGWKKVRINAPMPKNPM